MLINQNFFRFTFLLYRYVLLLIRYFWLVTCFFLLLVVTLCYSLDLWFSMNQFLYVFEYACLKMRHACLKMQHAHKMRHANKMRHAHKMRQSQKLKVAIMQSYISPGFPMSISVPLK